MRRRYSWLTPRFRARLDGQLLALKRHPEMAAAAPAPVERLEAALRAVRAAGLAQFAAKQALMSATDQEQAAIRELQDLFARNAGYATSVLGTQHLELDAFGVAVRSRRRAPPPAVETPPLSSNASSSTTSAPAPDRSNAA